MSEGRPRRRPVSEQNEKRPAGDGRAEATSPRPVEDCRGAGWRPWGSHARAPLGPLLERGAGDQLGAREFLWNSIARAVQGSRWEPCGSTGAQVRVETRLVRILRCDNRGSDTPIVRIFDDFSMVYDDVHSLHPRSTPCLAPIRGSVGAPREWRASGERGPSGSGMVHRRARSRRRLRTECVAPTLPFRLPGSTGPLTPLSPAGSRYSSMRPDEGRPRPASSLRFRPLARFLPFRLAYGSGECRKGGPGTRAGSWVFAVRRSRTRRRVEGCERLRRGRAGGSAPPFGSVGVEVRWSGAESEVSVPAPPRTAPYLGSPGFAGFVQYRAMAPKSSSTNQSPSRGSNLMKPFAASRVSSRRKVRSVTLP